MGPEAPRLNRADPKMVIWCVLSALVFFVIGFLVAGVGIWCSLPPANNPVSGIVANVGLSIIASFLANVLFWAGLGVSSSFWVTRRLEKSRRFLGVDKRNTIVVYLSRIQVEPSPNVPDRHGQPMVSPCVTVSQGEFDETPTLVDLLSKGFFYAAIAEGLVDRLYSTAKPKLKFEASPERKCGWVALASYPTICVGSSKWNEATHLYLEEMHSSLDFKRQPEEMGYDVGYVLKFSPMRDPDRTVFIFAGLGINGTRAALRYFAENFWRLVKQYGDNRSITVALVCPEAGKEPMGYEHATEVGQGETETSAWNRLRTAKGWP